MNTTRLVSGKIFFDDFDSTELNLAWTLVPNDDTRYSLAERPGYLKLFHSDPDVMLLLDEPEKYVLDMKNDYLPLSSLVQSGIVIFREIDNSLEILEYYDEEQDVSFVYEYMRVIKSGNVYTMYGRNTLAANWELVASMEFESAGKIGLICKGPAVAGSSQFQVDFVKIYKSNEVQLLNVPENYRVDLCRETTNEVIFSRKVNDPYNGVTLLLDDIPDARIYFKIFDESFEEVHTSSVFDMCGGDIYYYGSTLLVFVDGQSMQLDEEFFLGYFEGNKIDFEVELQNPHEVAFNDVVVSAIAYEGDIVAYTLVKFSLDPNALSEEYTESVVVPEIAGLGTTTLYGRVFREEGLEPSDVEPFRFNLE